MVSRQKYWKSERNRWKVETVRLFFKPVLAGIRDTAANMSHQVGAGSLLNERTLMAFI